MTEPTDLAVAHNRTPTELIQQLDLRRAIVARLAEQPVEDPSLRTAVWTFVGIERHAGTSPGHVITALTALIAAADIKPASRRQALTRRVILWGVEAYFGHLDGDVVGRDGDAFSDSPATPAWPTDVACPSPVLTRLSETVVASASIEARQPLTHSPLANHESLVNEATTFPSSGVAEPEESWYGDWRVRLTRKLSRRSDGRWEPLILFRLATAGETV